VFEVYTTGLGAQNQVCGGGTYQLASLLGGREAQSTGFGIGFDRIMEVAQTEIKRPSSVAVIFMPEVRAEAIEVVKQLRKNCTVVLDVMGRGMGAQLKYASSIGAGYAVIIGPKEVKEGLFTLRNMKSGVQQSLSLKSIEGVLNQ
jgi:histidyl-tRNA synthetase